MCLLDMMLMYSIGGAALGWFGMKLYKQYRSQKKANAKPTTNQNDHPVSSE